MRKEKNDKERVEAAIAPYSKLFLSMYDWQALGFACRFVWQCPSHHMLELYNKCVSANHLDIGIGTGYFIDHCSFPAANPRLALMDLSPNSLRAASKRLARYNPEIYQKNVLEPFNMCAPAFDSVAMMNLIHCLPGNMKTKGAVFRHAKAVMNPGAIIFGSTILYRDVKRNLLASLIMRINNRRGIMTNLEDDVQGLQKNLRDNFSESSMQIIGCEALFWARN